MSPVLRVGDAFYTSTAGILPGFDDRLS